MSTKLEFQVKTNNVTKKSFHILHIGLWYRLTLNLPQRLCLSWKESKVMSVC